MILVDTNVWVDHFRRREPEIPTLLGRLQLLIHPYVVGELALGNLRNRSSTLAFLCALPSAPVAEHSAVLELIERSTLYGRGVGYVDAHLLASVHVHGGARLWTRDRRLRVLAGELSVDAGLD